MDELGDFFQVVLFNDRIVLGGLNSFYLFFKQLVLLLEDVIGIDAAQVFLDEDLPRFVNFLELYVGLVTLLLQRPDPQVVGTPYKRANQIDRLRLQADLCQ